MFLRCEQFFDAEPVGPLVKSKNAPMGTAIGVLSLRQGLKPKPNKG
ncbi:hypothetical protein FB480_107149 [Agrobacterium vitis]|nr:hypothetical protein FB480_107149 [Agrobacterium vitis]